MTVVGLLLVAPVALLVPTRPVPRHGHLRMVDSTAIATRLQDQLAAIRALKPTEQSPDVQRSLWKAAGLNPMYKVSGSYTGEPSFTQLFTHETWTQYTGTSPFRRWGRTLWTWKHSTVLASVWPICVSTAIWSFGIASIPARLRPQTSPVPLTLMGSAIGLVLVFRVNNLYARVGEARTLWGRAVYLVRQAAQTVATSLLFDESLPPEQKDDAYKAAAKICRYLAAFPWELNAKLTGKGAGFGKTRTLQPGEDDEVLMALLPPEEAKWIANSRSRPLQLLGAMRRVLNTQLRRGTLHQIVYRKLDEDLKELDLVVGGCERLFSSPVPPTMSRHAIRCLLLWLIGLPLGLADTMAPASVALWAFFISYIFVGIEEVGAQVEQPFEITPMTRLCNVIMFNLQEAFAVPPRVESTEVL